jgi:hypothetical protein
MARSRPDWRGQSLSDLALDSDVDLLGNCERVIDFDTQISDGALDLGMPGGVGRFK